MNLTAEGLTKRGLNKKKAMNDEMNPTNTST